MKLAEALLLRAEYKNKLENLQYRILSNIKVQESDKPLENPQSLLNEAFEISEQLCALIKKINCCNNETKLSTGQTLSEAIVERDMIMKKRNILSAVASRALERDYRLTHTEIKMNIVISIADIQKQTDMLSRQFRELDAQIQALNWLTELQD